MIKPSPLSRPKEGPSQRSHESNEHAPITVIVADDQRFVRELITTMLARQERRYKVVAETGNAAAAVEACRELKPDLLIMDINLPDRSGIEVVPDIKEAAPDTRVLLCTTSVTDDSVVDALRCGADGFVEKTNSWSDFVEAIEHVTRGERYFRTQSSPKPGGRGLSARRVSTASHVPLTQREKEVLTLIARGDTSKEIASKLGISVGTIDTHRTNMMRKLHIRNIAGLVVYAFRTGLIELSE